MSKFATSKNRAALLRYTALIALIPGAFANVSPAKALDLAPIDLETIVVTGTRFNAEIAPAKASLDTTQPETIINKSYIENFLPPQSDYVTILAIAPGLTGTDVNGPGLSDGNVKNTMRGIQDGMFGMSYDGIPFGDTNGPSHHSESYFPGSTIGSIAVDRGPGNAGTLGAATWGGTIQIYSEELIDQQRFKASVSYGAFNTDDVTANYQSGAFGTDPTRIMVNVERAYSDGALTLQNLTKNNALIKVDHKFGADWTVTLFSNYNFLQEHLNDSNGATSAQIAAYGNRFAMQNTNPNLPTYEFYNKSNKGTDMDYARLQGTAHDIKIDDTLYSYAYWNHTFTATDIQQTQADIAANTAEGMSGTTTPIVNGVKRPGDVPGYTKLNAYRVWGNILRLSDDYNFGAVTGQVRAGIWWEGQKTSRSRFDFDMTKCLQDGIDPFNGNISTAQADCGSSALTATGKAVLTAQGNAEYDERSKWYQYQPFVEVDIKPVEGLTLTPGLKYIDWLHKTDGLEQKLIQYFQGEYTTKKTLPFAEANYKIQPSWSVYFQYAQGIYVPDISTFEQKTGPTLTFPAPETTTNYQLGTVYYADNFTADADVYDIPVKNNYVAQLCSITGGPANDSCFVNTGTATYKGLEGETTYALRGDLDGFMLFANGALMSSKTQGVWIDYAPAWTVAGGVLYKRDAWKFSVIDKAVGPQHQYQAATAAGIAASAISNYDLAAYNTLGLSAGYTQGHFELGLSVNNMLNSRKTVAITINDKTYQTNRLTSLDQYYFQAPTSVMLTLKAVY